MERKKRVFIYVRVSTTEQAEEGYSLSEQEERLIKYCEAMGWEVVMVYHDPGFSGGNMDRPGLQEMIREIEKGSADIVLVDKLDRLSRSQFDTLYLIKKVFNENNVAFVSRAEAFDTSTPFGRAMVGILAVFAELERERIKERMSEGKIGRVKEGLHPGGNTIPYGYEYNVDTGRMEINEYEAMVVKEIFEMIAARTPISTLCKILTDKGYITKTKRNWGAQVIKRMAVNKSYIGKILFKGKWYDGVQDHIISDELFQKVQKVMKDRDIKYDRFKPGKKYSSPLGSLIWCANCGAKYGYRKYSNGKRAYYVCYSRSKCDKKLIKDPDCRNRNYRDFEIENIVYNEILKLKSDPLYFEELRNSVDPKEKIKLIQKQVDDITGRISKFMDMYSMDGINANDVTAKIAPLNKERSLLEDEIAYLENEAISSSKEDVMNVVTIFESVLKTGDTSKIHDAIMEIIDYIEIDKDDIKIHWRF